MALGRSLTWRGPTPQICMDTLQAAERPAPCSCSLCPTFAAVALFINNARWDGVPFLLKAGKALANRRTEIRVQFRNVPGNLFSDRLSLNGMDLDRSTNELVCYCACCAPNAGSKPRAGASRCAGTLECSKNTISPSTPCRG